MLSAFDIRLIIQWDSYKMYDSTICLENITISFE